MPGAQAGGVDRQPSDDDGHHGAARFNGPTEAFNRLAPNANFNRCGYRVREDERPTEKYTGRAETVRNVPRFDDGSVRPSQFNWALGSSHTCPKGQSPKTVEENERLEHWCQGKETMIAAQVARIISNFAIFCELSDDDVVDPDEACGVMEVLGSQLEAMDKPFLRKLVDAFPIIAVEYSGKAQELVRDLPYGFYLEEALALDDPARLAELGAIRDARP